MTARVTTPHDSKAVLRLLRSRTTHVPFPAWTVCFASVAKRVSVVEYDRSYCEKLEARRDSVLGPLGRNGSFAVHCGNFFERGAVPDADVYTWWQDTPSLANARVLRHLARLRRHGFERIWRIRDTFDPKAAWSRNISHSAWRRGGLGEAAAKLPTCA